MAIKKGDKVKIEYTGTLDDGTVFDSSGHHGKPLEFEIGGKQVIKGFEEALLGLNKGDSKKFTLKPNQAYGDINPQLVQHVPKDRLPEGKELTKGMVVGVQLPNGMQVPARITDVTGSTVTIDLNHPLAGKTLHFEIKIVDSTV